MRIGTSQWTYVLVISTNKESVAKRNRPTGFSGRSTVCTFYHGGHWTDEYRNYHQVILFLCRQQKQRFQPNEEKLQNQLDSWTHDYREPT